MRRVCLILGLVCSLALVVPACGGGGGDRPSAAGPEPKDTTESSETASTVPEPGEPLSAGKRYATTKFEPALSFRIVDEGWQVAGAEIPDVFDIIRQKPFLVIAFNNPRKVYDPKRPVEQIAKPEPEDWVAWFQNHPYLKTGETISVNIGGASGVRFDWEASSVPENYPERCGDPCIPLWPLSDGGQYDAYLGDQYQFTIVNVEGETVLIDVFIDAENVDAANREVQEVLDTVEWENAS